MPALPQAALVALVLVSTLVGCGDSKPASSSPTASTSVTSSTPTVTGTPSATPSASPSADPQATPSSAGCDATGSKIPDGTWTGPITADIRADQEQSGYDDSRGTGQLTMTVRNGSVASGTWSLTWKSHGEVKTSQASATVDFTGSVDGKADGSAAKPNLSAAWRIKGITEVTEPAQTSAPFDETGSDKAALRIKSSTCAQATGTFTSRFISKDTAATFTGTARWIGTRR